MASLRGRTTGGADNPRLPRGASNLHIASPCTNLGVDENGDPNQTVAVTDCAFLDGKHRAAPRRLERPVLEMGPARVAESASTS